MIKEYNVKKFKTLIKYKTITFSIKVRWKTLNSSGHDHQVASSIISQMALIPANRWGWLKQKTNIDIK